MGSPSWGQILKYELEIRKAAYRAVNEGDYDTIVDALAAKMGSTELQAKRDELLRMLLLRGGSLGGGTRDDTIWLISELRAIYHALAASKASGAPALAASAAAMRMPDRRQRFITTSNAKDDLVAAKKVEPKPPGFLQPLYAAAGVATTATWANIVRTTIRSNQPVGAMMPSVQHQIFARTSVLSAVPLIVSAYGILASASHQLILVSTPQHVTV